MTTLSTTTRSGRQPRSGLVARGLAALRAWRLERQTRRALEGLTDEQLKDIGYRRTPVDPPHYERTW